MQLAVLELQSYHQGFIECCCFLLLFNVSVISVLFLWKGQGFIEDYGSGVDRFRMDELSSSTKTKKQLREEKKKKKAIAEFRLAQSNDNMKRPGELLDSEEAKKVKIIDPGEVGKLDPAEFKKLKQLLKDRKKLLSQIPRFTLQGGGLSAALSVAHDEREPLFMTDIQHLLLYGLCGNSVVPPPSRWCYLEKANRLTHIVALIVEGVTSEDFLHNEHLFPKLTEHFSNRVEFMSPVYYGRDVVQELSCIPLTNSQKEAILQKWGSMDKAVSEKDIVKQFRPIFPTSQPTEAESTTVAKTELELPASDVFPRTYLLLGLHQMACEGYPMPFWSSTNSKFSDFKLSRHEYNEVSCNSPMFAIDCEMVLTSKNRSELARIAVVNEKLEVVYESFVKPKIPITNYLTQYSGITEKLLKDVSTTLEDVQEALKSVLPADAIIVGHSLNFDLAAIKIMHPYVIDTSVIFNLKGREGMKSKLSTLTEVFLSESIQTSKDGHCPIEDAKATMKLVKLKLANGFLFGDNVASSDQPAIPESILTCSIFNRVYKFKKTVAVIGPEKILKEYDNVTATPPDGTAFSPIPVESNKDALGKLCEVATSHQLTLAHLDISEKLEGPASSSTKKKQKALKKLDKWCDIVFNHTSVNGMCLVVFAGPKQIPALVDNEISSGDASEPNKKSLVKSENSTTNCDNYPSSSSNSSPSSTTQADSNSSETQSENHTTSPPIPRRNGVCFIRINGKKV